MGEQDGPGVAATDGQVDGRTDELVDGRADGPVDRSDGRPAAPGDDVLRIALQVRRLDPTVALPTVAHAFDAGLDLAAAEACTLAPGARAAVGTGLAIAVPPGWVGLVHPRSGLALRHGLTVANAPGTIDAGYRGELKVLLVNLGDEAVDIARGDRIAQLLLQQVGLVEVVEVEDLDTTQRGAGGFGSSGV